MYQGFFRIWFHGFYISLFSPEKSYYFIETIFQGGLGATIMDASPYGRRMGQPKADSCGQKREGSTKCGCPHSEKRKILIFLFISQEISSMCSYMTVYRFPNTNTAFFLFSQDIFKFIFLLYFHLVWMLLTNI